MYLFWELQCVLLTGLYRAHLTFNSGTSSACHHDSEKWHLWWRMWEKERNSTHFGSWNDQSKCDSLWTLAISAVTTSSDKAKKDCTYSRPYWGYFMLHASMGSLCTGEMQVQMQKIFSVFNIYKFKPRAHIYFKSEPCQALICLCSSRR